MSGAAASIPDRRPPQTRDDSHEQSGQTCGGRGSVASTGSRRNRTKPFHSGNPRQQAFAKLHLVLTSAGTSTARAGRSGDPGLICSTGNAKTVHRRSFYPSSRPKMLPIADEELTDDQAGQVSPCSVMMTTSCRALSLRIRMQLKLSCPDLWAMRSSLNAERTTRRFSGSTGSGDARLLAARQVAGRQLWLQGSPAQMTC
jgi:hypothetical protein